MLSMRRGITGGLLLLLLLLAHTSALTDNSMPNPINTCGHLATTVTTLDEGMGFESATPPEGYPPQKLEASRISASLGYNINDNSDVTKPSAGMGSSILFARPYLRALSCMDGRQTGYILGAPGAEMGMFIIAMHSYLQLKGSLSNLTRGDYDKLLTAYFTMREETNLYLVDPGRPFTIHTDYDSLLKLLTSANVIGPNAPNGSNFSLSDISDSFNGSTLTKAQQQAFLDQLTEEHADYFGCGHIYRLLSTWDFPFSKTLVVNAVRGVLSYMFNNADFGPRIQFQVLYGKHIEGAVVMFESKITDAPCRYAAGALRDYTFRDQDLLPMFTPRIVQRYNTSLLVQSVLVIHEQAIDFRMDEYARFFTKLAASDMAANAAKSPLQYFTVAPTGQIMDFRAAILTSMRNAWQQVKVNVFSGCVADKSLCFNYLPRYLVTFKRVYDPEYQTIASVLMILGTLVLWFLLWRCYSRLDKGETLMPNMKMVDKLFQKTMGGSGSGTGAYLDEREPIIAPQPTAAATAAPVPIPALAMAPAPVTTGEPTLPANTA